MEFSNYFNNQNTYERDFNLVDNFCNHDDVVIVTNMFSVFDKAINAIIDRFKTEKRNFAIAGMENSSYIIVRAVEEVETYKNSIGRKVLVSDYVDWNGVDRHIVEKCPEGKLVKFYVEGKEIYFNPDFI